MGCASVPRAIHVHRKQFLEVSTFCRCFHGVVLVLFVKLPFVSPGCGRLVRLGIRPSKDRLELFLARVGGFTMPPQSAAASAVSAPIMRGARQNVPSASSAPVTCRRLQAHRGSRRHHPVIRAARRQRRVVIRASRLFVLRKSTPFGLGKVGP